MTEGLERAFLGAIDRPVFADIPEPIALGRGGVGLRDHLMHDRLRLPGHVVGAHGVDADVRRDIE